VTDPGRSAQLAHALQDVPAADLLELLWYMCGFDPALVRKSCQAMVDDPTCPLPSLQKAADS
jgi:hypothetical protein